MFFIWGRILVAVPHKNHLFIEKALDTGLWKLDELTFDLSITFPITYMFLLKSVTKIKSELVQL